MSNPPSLSVLAVFGELSVSAGVQAAPTVAPYGGWASPIGAERLAAGAVSLDDLQVHGGHLYWRESRPDEGGRQVLMRMTPDGRPEQLTPDGFNVRTRVHEYGGASYVVLDDDAVVFSEFADQRLYFQRSGAAPVAITPPGYRYADCRRHPTRNALVCVREDHTEATVAANGEERNEIVLLALPEDGGGDFVPGPGRVLVSGTDFVAYPRISPDGRRLAWLWWNHPDMPWDSARLSLAELEGDDLGTPTTIAGGADQAAIEPRWSADGRLHFIDEPTGWWNLYAWGDGGARPLTPSAREYGGPLWSQGASTYALPGDGRVLAASSLAGVDRLELVPADGGESRVFDLPFVAFAGVRLLDARRAVAIASSALAPPALILVDLDDGKHRVLHRPVASDLDPALVARGEPIEFPTAAGPASRAPPTPSTTRRPTPASWRRRASGRR